MPCRLCTRSLEPHAHICFTHPSFIFDSSRYLLFAVVFDRDATTFVDNVDGVDWDATIDKLWDHLEALLRKKT